MPGSRITIDAKTGRINHYFHHMGSGAEMVAEHSFPDSKAIMNIVKDSLLPHIHSIADHALPGTGDILVDGINHMVDHFYNSKQGQGVGLGPVMDSMFEDDDDEEECAPCSKAAQMGTGSMTWKQFFAEGRRKGIPASELGAQWRKSHPK